MCRGRIREGKTHIGAYFNPDFKRSLCLIQAQTGEDVQQLIARAFNEMFCADNVHRPAILNLSAWSL